MAQYSAFVVDHATVCCFFELQLIGVDPRKMTYVVVDCRSSRSPAYSASAKACRLKGEFRRMSSPWSAEPLRYRSTLFTAFQCKGGMDRTYELYNRIVLAAESQRLLEKLVWKQDNLVKMDACRKNEIWDRDGKWVGVFE
ncbi:hypothetical protein LWI29_011128 [Acer saccharum]|uniref:Uncharacterized protein n=1 Tax=Acer saccharum TaxID=4024 RepID=A0AA39VRI7_ACESA|nr:hypothetical protein LWI29_011128 [Acer saccharum]